jgi:uncharacterized protein YkwD
MKKRIATLSLLSGFALLLLSDLLVTGSAAQSERAKKIPQQKTPAPNNQRQNKNQPPRQPQILQTKYDLTEAPVGYVLSELEFVERYCFDEVNHQREAQNLAPLIFSAELLPLARQYSRRLAEEKFFSHTDPEGRTTENRIREAGIKFSVIGENLSQAKGYLDPVPDVVQQWMTNPAHRANILNMEYQYAAVGVWITDKTFFFTEIFLTK